MRKARRIGWPGQLREERSRVSAETWRAGLSGQASGECLVDYTWRQSLWQVPSPTPGSLTLRRDCATSIAASKPGIALPGW